MKPKFGDFIFTFFYIYSDSQSQIYSFTYRHAPDFSEPVFFLIFFFQFLAGRVSDQRWGSHHRYMLKLNETTIAKKVKYQPNYFVQQYISTLATCRLFQKVLTLTMSPERKKSQHFYDGTHA